MNVTDLMLDYIIKKSNNDISDEVYLKSKYCLIDYLGVTYAGAKENIDTIEKVCGQKRAFAGLCHAACYCSGNYLTIRDGDGGYERCQPPVSFLVCHRRFAGLRRADVLVPHGEKRRSIHCRGRIAKPFLRFFLPEAVICGKMQDRTVKTASCLEDEGHVFTKTDFTRSLYFEIGYPQYGNCH